MRFFSKRSRNSIIAVLTIASMTLIATIESDNQSTSLEYSTEPNNESQSNSTTQSANSDSTSPEPEPDQETQTEPPTNSTTPDRTLIKLQKEIDTLQQSLQKMQQNRNEINDLYQRSIAENENLAKRYQKQIEEAKTFGIQRFSRDLLDIVDVLHKAIESVPNETVSDDNPHLKNLYEGLTMAESEFKTVFSRHGLEIYSPLDEKFDANFHEALFEQEVEGKPPGVVFVVSKPGYKLRGRVIRPALVGVTK